MIEVSRNKEFKGLYIHTKSSSYPVSHERKDVFNFWRKIMNHQVISNWTTCYDKIQDFDLVGTLYKSGNTKDYWKLYSKVDNKKYTDHFSGNFFWFDSNYYKGLPYLKSEEKQNRFNAEWISFKNNPKTFEVFTDLEYFKNELNSLIKRYKVIRNHSLQKVDISVIITAYNYEKCIVKAIDSVINNKFGSLEIVIVNDCSTDNSLEKVLPYLESDSNITIIDKKYNTGVCDSRNIGIYNCVGEYVFILDSDNEIYEDCLETHIDRIKSDGTIACYGIIECFNEKNIFLYNVSNHPFDYDKLKWGNYIDAMAMFKKSEIMSLGGYSDEVWDVGRGWEDYELWLRIGSMKYEVSFIDKPLSRYLKKSNSLVDNLGKYYRPDIINFLDKKYGLYFN
jgi:hypothetical protein